MTFGASWHFLILSLKNLSILMNATLSLKGPSDEHEMVGD